MIISFVYVLIICLHYSFWNYLINYTVTYMYLACLIKLGVICFRYIVFKCDLYINSLSHFYSFSLTSSLFLWCICISEYVHVFSVFCIYLGCIDFRTRLSLMLLVSLHMYLISKINVSRIIYTCIWFEIWRSSVCDLKFSMNLLIRETIYNYFKRLWINIYYRIICVIRKFFIEIIY